jgi:limonene-1,2-epoxide hydrolase
MVEAAACRKTCARGSYVAINTYSMTSRKQKAKWEGGRGKVTGPAWIQCRATAAFRSQGGRVIKWRKDAEASMS